MKLITRQHHQSLKKLLQRELKRVNNKRNKIKILHKSKLKNSK